MVLRWHWGLFDCLGHRLFHYEVAMIIPVHMFAFSEEGDKSRVRNVQIPISTDDDISLYKGDELNSVLEMVYKYGQNEFQPMQFPSVSVGDVAQVGNRYFMVVSMGFKEMSKAEVDGLEVPTCWSAFCRGTK